MSRALIAIGIAVLGAGIVLWLRERLPSPPPTSRTNLVFVLVDTLRADHLISWGSERPTSPRLAELAAESVLFENATPQATCTFPSANSLLTSRHPVDFLRQPERAMGIPAEIPTLASLLKRGGYTTHAVSASPIVRNRPSRFNPSGGFGAGFDGFDEDCMWQEAGCVNRRAVALLTTLDEPFALYLHYMDPHGPYRPPSGYPRRFAGEYEGKPFIAKGNPVPIERMLYGDGPDLDLQPEDIGHLKDLYDDEIGYFDLRFAEIVEVLRESGLLDRTLLVIASDHGEDFMEHEHIKHCRSVYNTLTHTPLLIRLPGATVRGRRSALAQNLDLLPTILDYLEVPAPEAGLAGRSLRPVIESDEPVNAYAFTHQGVLRAVRDERHKLILDEESGAELLFDVAADPDETRDLRAERPAEAERLRVELDRRIDAERAGSDTEGTLLGRELEKRLEALGYLE